jgi:hypothetical protein
MGMKGRQDSKPHGACTNGDSGTGYGKGAPVAAVFTHCYCKSLFWGNFRSVKEAIE